MKTEFKAGASDYDALQILYTFIKKWRSADWEQDREKAQDAMAEILAPLRESGDPKYKFVKFLLMGYDYARESELDND